MGLFMHLEFDAPFFSGERAETVLCEAEKHGASTLLASGSFLADEVHLSDFLSRISGKRLAVFLQIPMNAINRVIGFQSSILCNPLIKGIILEGDGLSPSEYSGIIQSISVIQNAGKTAAIRLYFLPRPSIAELRSWLEILAQTKISDLIVESEVDFLERDERLKDDYFELLMNHKSFLDRIKFQCTFLEEFRPRNCLYLSSQSPCVMLKDETYVLCPYQLEADGGRSAIGSGIKSALEEIKKVQRDRYIKYAKQNRPFTCGDCIREKRHDGK